MVRTKEKIGGGAGRDRSASDGCVLGLTLRSRRIFAGAPWNTPQFKSHGERERAPTTVFREKLKRERNIGEKIVPTPRRLALGTPIYRTL